MRLTKGKTGNIQLAFYIVLTLICFYVASWSMAILIQLPPARGNYTLYVILCCSIGAVVIAVVEIKKLTKTKFSRASYLFVLFTISISSLLFVLLNLICKLSMAIDRLIALSVLVSTPLSCVVAGYSKRTIIKELKKLGLDNGITLIALLTLSLIPIIQYPYSFHFTNTATVLPDVVFYGTENTTYVNGLVNSSGFFATVPILQNRTFLAEDIVELAATNSVRNIELRFGIASFVGNFNLLEDLEVYAVSGQDRVSVISLDNGYVQCANQETLLKSNSTFLLSIRCAGASFVATNEILALSLSIFYSEALIQTIHISFSAVE